VFCDLRGYTAFTETAEPERYSIPARIPRRAGAARQPVRGNARPVLGRRHHGVLQRPRADPRSSRARGQDGGSDARGGRFAVSAWRERGLDLGFGVGIAQRYVTLGQIGVSERSALYRNRHGLQCRCPSLCRGEARPNSAQSALQRRTSLVKFQCAPRWNSRSNSSRSFTNSAALRSRGRGSGTARTLPMPPRPLAMTTTLSAR
jgi:hypothetical protein